MAGFSNDCPDCGKPTNECDCDYRALFFAVAMMLFWGITLAGMLIIRALS